MTHGTGHQVRRFTADVIIVIMIRQLSLEVLSLILSADPAIRKLLTLRLPPLIITKLSPTSRHANNMFYWGQ